MEHFAEIDGQRVHYAETGKPDGKPAVVMHGWGCDLTTVRSIAAALEDSMRVISVDLPGHGKSDEPRLLPDGKPWGVYEYADLMERLMDELKIEEATLIGHSYGGRIAIVLASREGTKNRIAKTVLVDSAGIKPKRKLKYYLKVYSFKSYKKIMPLIVGGKKAEEMTEKKRAKAGSADYRNSSPMMRMVMSRSVNQDLKDHLPKISAPTLLIWGENDTATPLSDGRLMEKLIPDAGLVTVKGAGHYSFLDNPGLFKAVILSFLIN